MGLLALSDLKRPRIDLLYAAILKSDGERVLTVGQVRIDQDEVMNASGDKKVVPIGDLSIEQLTSLQKQVEQEITFFTESLTELKIFEGKFTASEQAVSSIDPNAQRAEALIPLSESMYISAVMANPWDVLVEIGTGYFAEMSIEKAKDFFKRKQEYLKKQIATVEGIIPEKRRARQVINENLQKKVQALCAQLPHSSK